jgi:hypothetical protein
MTSSGTRTGRVTPAPPVRPLDDLRPAKIPDPEWQ